jgi:hypothetical protein
MNEQELSDREDLELMRKFLAAHIRRGTLPQTESLLTYGDLRRRVAAAGSAAA